MTFGKPRPGEGLYHDDDDEEEEEAAADSEGGGVADTLAATGFLAASPAGEDPFGGSPWGSSPEAALMTWETRRASG